MVSRVGNTWPQKLMSYNICKGEIMETKSDKAKLWPAIN
jgi:hypothetical protein